MDIGLFIDDEQDLDFAVANDDLTRDDGLETAVLLSLFSDGRADKDDTLPSDNPSRRGTWFDLYPEVDGDKWGSKLWLLERGKKNQQVLIKINNYVTESLKWMKDENIASTILSESSFYDNEQVRTIISITKPSNVTEKYNVLWNGQEVKREVE